MFDHPVRSRQDGQSLMLYFREARLLHVDSIEVSEPDQASGQWVLTVKRGSHTVRVSLTEVNPQLLHQAAVDAVEALGGQK